MSTPADYVAFLARKGVKLSLDNGQLRYHAKKGVLGADELARLRSMRGEIVLELTRTESHATELSTGTPPASAAEAPLSFQQRWLLKLIEEHTGWKATLSRTFCLKGALDTAALARSFEEVLRVHAPLRTRIVRVGGKGRQQIVSLNGFQLPVVQASGESDAERGQNALLLAYEMGARELDPAVAPLMAAQLIRLSAQEHLLVLRVHRLATDCLGIGHAVRDLWSHYAQAMQSFLVPLWEESAQYRDYALWQHATDEAWREKHATYWNDYLAGAEPIHWPVKEYAPAASRDTPGELASLESRFGEILSAGLRELGRQTQTLPALVTLALYVACAAMCCRQRDLVVPFQVAGRSAAHESIVGCFAHIVYLRIRLTGGENFIELLKLVASEFYRAAAFRQDSGRTVTERPELLRGTFCQWLAWHPADIPGFQADGPLSPPGLEVETIRCQSVEELTNVPPILVDLEMTFFDAAGDISALATYRTHRFAQGTPARLMRELQSVAERVVRDPRAPLMGHSEAS